MYRIDPALGCFNREFVSFQTALRVLENELHGDVSSYDDMEWLWNRVMENGKVYLGETTSGHLFIVVTHCSNGTWYVPEFRNSNL